VKVGEFIAPALLPAASGVTALASPKSSILTVPSPRRMTLAGFRSRWTMPSSCADSSAAAICQRTSIASAIGSAPRAIAARQVFAIDELHHQARVCPWRSMP
jgi:hypothetical protein